jgi:hypothetical protein
LRLHGNKRVLQDTAIPEVSKQVASDKRRRVCLETTLAVMSEAGRCFHVVANFCYPVGTMATLCHLGNYFSGRQFFVVVVVTYVHVRYLPVVLIVSTRTLH